MSVRQYACLWDGMSGGKCEPLGETEGYCQGVATSPCGLYAATTAYPTVIWNVKTKQKRVVLQGSSERSSNAVAFSRDGNRIATVEMDLHLWEARTGLELAVCKGHTDWIRSAAFSPDGREVLTGSFDSTARFWDAATGEALAVFTGSRV